MAADSGTGVAMQFVVGHLRSGRFAFPGEIGAITILADTFISAILAIAAAYSDILERLST